MATAEHSTMAIGLVAHDSRKDSLSQWVQRHRDALSRHSLYATGTTGSVLKKACPELTIHCLKSGPLGGDQQLGAMICQGLLSALIFYIDPLSPHPHDVDIKALIRLATHYNIPYACNQATAELMISHFKNP